MLADSIPKDMNRPWEDPMTESGTRALAQEMRGQGLGAQEVRSPGIILRCGRL